MDSVLHNEQSWAIVQGDALEVLKTMPDESIQCVVTSPPYWGLRDYGVAGQLGLEKAPEEYVSKMVEIFREVRRVLRYDGTLWLNLGDSYNSKPNQRSKDDLVGWKQATNIGSRTTPNRNIDTLKPKDLIGIPWRIAFALQADGWWLRSDIVWSKPNPMPESVLDRPTRAHEYIFLMTKSERYFYDAEAIKEESVHGIPNSLGSIKSPYGQGFTRRAKMDKQRGHSRTHAGFNDRWDQMSKEEQKANGRNKRSVWSVATHPFPEAHFATFPPKLIEPCILAGTSEKGCCPDCGAAWKRVLLEGSLISVDGTKSDYRPTKTTDDPKVKGRSDGWTPNHFREKKTVGWEPSCSCGASQAVPCIALDLFAGAGTTGLVCSRLGRRFIGIELNPEYIGMAKKRIIDDAPLFNPVET